METYFLGLLRGKLEKRTQSHLRQKYIHRKEKFNETAIVKQFYEYNSRIKMFIGPIREYDQKCASTSLLMGIV